MVRHRRRARPGHQNALGGMAVGIGESAPMSNVWERLANFSGQPASAEKLHVGRPT
jgi:hypothetical protein